MSKSKDAIKLGVHGAFIFQYCLYTELGKNVIKHPSIKKKEERGTKKNKSIELIFYLKDLVIKQNLIGVFFFFSVFMNTYFSTFFFLNFLVCPERMKLN